MAFRVHKKEHSYVTMTCHHLRDTNLSYQAMGMLSFMLSNDTDFKYSIIGLSKCASNGETSVRTILNELKEKGYLIITPIKSDNGRIECWDYDFFESPQDAVMYLNPDVGDPDVENPHVENCTQSNINIRNNNKSKESSTTSSTPKENNQQAIFEDYDIPQEKVLDEKATIQLIMGFWNTETKFTKIRSIEGTRRKMLIARLKEEGADNVMKAIQIANQSSFLTEKWKMNFDWFVKPSNFNKVVEGNYNDTVKLSSAQARVKEYLEAALRRQAEESI